MDQRPTLNPINEATSAVRETLSRADHALQSGEDAGWLIETAFLETRLLLEAIGLTEALDSLVEAEVEARKDYSETKYADEIGEEYLVWGAHVWKYLKAIDVAFGEPKGGTITKDVIQILRETLYSITDRNCFSTLPANETDVHVRIEAVLRCVFPDLLHKPQITKQIKHFEPDTGIPGLRMLIEYKFIASSKDAKRVSDEVLADTRGYVSKDWDQFIYVIYETKRIKPEKQWEQLLRSSGVGRSTSVIVLNGEEPPSGKKQSPKTVVPGTSTTKH